jgi:O-succinylbenzoic acid--CoA ligase
MESKADSEMKIHPEFAYNGVQMPEQHWVAYITERMISAPEWERTFLEFIAQWLDENESIEVQTSGSSGRPTKWKAQKSSMLASATLTVNYFKCKSGTTAFLCLPGNFIAGKMMLVRAMAFGWKLTAVKPSSTPMEELHTPFDFAAFTPMQLAKLKPDETRLLARFGVVIIGGAALSESLRRRLSDECSNLYETYGMAETLSHVAVRKLTAEETPFQALEGITFKVEGNGRLQIEAPYIQREFIQTNDVVELMGPSSFLFKGRYDRMINSGGVKLFAEVIERKLQSVLKVPFAISSVHDDILGQKVVLFMESTVDLNKDELNQKMMLHLDRFEVPKEIMFVEKLERTESGKIKIIKSE